MPSGKKRKRGDRAEQSEAMSGVSIGDVVMIPSESTTYTCCRCNYYSTRSIREIVEHLRYSHNVNIRIEEERG